MKSKLTVILAGIFGIHNARDAVMYHVFVRSRQEEQAS